MARPHSKGSPPMPYLILLIAFILVLAFAITYWYISLGIALIIFAAVKVPPMIREIRKNRYFASEEFVAHKAALAEVVAEHNDIAEYVEELHANGSFEIGSSSTGSHAHLATFENTSRHNYRRDRNLAVYEDTNVHNCSLQVVRNAAKDPIKYLMKYFDIKATEDTLGQIEELGESVSRLEEATRNLEEREASITTSIDPPAFILEYFHDEFMGHVGIELSPVEVPYPVYVFEYVSAGGNSSQTTTITLDTPTLDALIETMSEKIRFRKSAAGQRALMTAKLRDFIKSRDDYACKFCGVALEDEPHLLLEVDHIIPLAKGGLSTEDNLQTLCWRCNRSKSDKILEV